MVFQDKIGIYHKFVMAASYVCRRKTVDYIMKLSKHLLQIVGGGILFHVKLQKKSPFSLLKVHYHQFHQSIGTLLNMESTTDVKIKNKIWKAFVEGKELVASRAIIECWGQIPLNITCKEKLCFTWWPENFPLEDCPSTYFPLGYG